MEIRFLTPDDAGVATTETAAVNLYRSLGFKPFGREPRALRVEGKFIDEEYMVLGNRVDDHHRGG
jgi:ribosomal protein S18 acetylase RimI-like enzyme